MLTAVLPKSAKHAHCCTAPDLAPPCRCRPAAGRKEVVSGSLDKTMALWRFPEPDDEATLAEGGACCALSGVQEIVRLDPAGAPIFSLAVDGAAPGSDPRNPDERQQVRARPLLCAV